MVLRSLVLFLCFLILLILPINSVYSITQITEISFIEPEFIEIYSNESLNMSNIKVFDENSGFNKLELIQKKSSPFYLIIGSDFLKNLENNNNDTNNKSYLNFSKLNCSVYITSSTSPGKYGLKDKGENITLEINSNQNLTYTNLNIWNFLSNESLNQNLNSSNYFKTTQSICSFPSFIPQITLNKTNNTVPLNQFNSSQNNLTQNCDMDFNIDIEDKVFTNKIQFKFNTNKNNYEIEYWIEDYSKNLIQSKRTTSNTNLKSFTPKAQTQLYLIKAKLISNSCSKEDSKLAIFYFNSNQNLNENLENSIIKSNQAYINILNENDLLNHKTNYIEYEIYRADSKKQILVLSQDKNKLNEIYLDKYSKLRGKTLILPYNSSSKISFLGFGLEQTITLYPPEFIFINNTPNISKSQTKPVFNTIISSINTNAITFILNNSFQNISGECYVLYIRTKISNILNINNMENSILNFNLNLSKLSEKEKLLSYPLKLTCKYNKYNQATINYNHLEFNYTILKNKSEITSKQSININLSQNKSNLTQKSNSNYISKNQKIKSISFFPVFFATVLLLIVLIIKR